MVGWDSNTPSRKNFLFCLSEDFSFPIAKAIGNSGKSNEKSRKAVGLFNIFGAKIVEVLGNFTN